VAQAILPASVQSASQKLVADRIVCVTTLEPQSLFKKNSFALNTCASAEEKIAQLRRIVITIVLWIEAEKDFAARDKVTLQIAQEKIPFRCAPPFFPRMVKIKVDRKRRDPIKLLREIGQRLECADSAHDPRNSEKLEQFRKKRDALHVQSQD